MMFLLYLMVKWTMALIVAAVVAGIVLIWFVVWGVCKLCALLIEVAEEGPPTRMRAGAIPQSRWSDRR